MKKKVVYVAHPLGGAEDRERNRTNAAKWCAYFAEMRNVAPIADWIILSGVWDESKRDFGLEIDLALVERCDELWLCGGRISPGMRIETDHAIRCGIPVEDFTMLGYEPPKS